VRRNPNYTRDLVARGRSRIGESRDPHSEYHARVPLLSARAVSRVVIVVGLAGFGGCTLKTPFAGLAEARRLAADLESQFTKAADAANRAVMADTDEASDTYARESRDATESVQKTADALASVLNEFGFSEEVNQLADFRAQFTEYRTLDRSILDLAVENTNLKAQRLAFGGAREAADALQDALEAVAPQEPARDVWHVTALAAMAVARVREIQALQAPHIAEADDAAMTALEKRMAAAEGSARKALEGLSGLARPASRPRLAEAKAALDRFMQINAQIITLSRRNSNVRSLALSLNQKRVLTAACEDRLHTLRDSLARRSFAGTR